MWDGRWFFTPLGRKGMSQCHVSVGGLGSPVSGFLSCSSAALLGSPLASRTSLGGADRGSESPLKLQLGSLLMKRRRCSSLCTKIIGFVYFFLFWSIGSIPFKYKPT